MYSPAVQAEVRALAKAAGLPNQARRDSQGICFLGKVKFSEFVEQHLGVWPGCIVEEETGGVLGYHQGFCGMSQCMQNDGQKPYPETELYA